MLKYFCFCFFLLVSFNCKQKSTSFQIPDITKSFNAQLKKADSTLVVDSFYLIGIDTMTEKASLWHTRFPYFHILSKLDNQLENLKKNTESVKGVIQSVDLQKMEELKEERQYVIKELDSINSLLTKADSVKPVGYRAIYKITVHKPNSFTISDTVAYALSKDMIFSDWNRNIEKAIDSISMGHHATGVGPLNIKASKN